MSPEHTASNEEDRECPECGSEDLDRWEREVSDGEVRVTVYCNDCDDEQTDTHEA